MPPTKVRRDRETRVSHRERFAASLGANQNRCDRSKGDANSHKHSQNSPNVAGGLDGANLANGRANFTGRGRFFKTFIAAFADSTATRFDNGWTGKTLKTKTMNITDYHNMTDRISKSGLDKIHRSPAHFKTQTKETDAMRVGRITHEFILEGVQNFVPLPFDSFRTKEAREWRDSQTLPIITAAEIETIHAMREAVLRHPEASRLLSNGQAEQTFLFDEPTTGAPCRCRTDWMTGDGVIVDLKTTTDASPRGFGKAVQKFRYHVQDAFYTDGVEASTGCRPTDFVFIAVEKTAPFGVGVYRLSEGLREEGRDMYLENVATWMECTERDEWPAYSNEIIEII